MILWNQLSLNWKNFQFEDVDLHELGHSQSSVRISGSLMQNKLSESEWTYDWLWCYDARCLTIWKTTLFFSLSQVLNITRSSGATKSTVSRTSEEKEKSLWKGWRSSMVHNQMRDLGKRAVSAWFTLITSAWSQNPDMKLIKHFTTTWKNICPLMLLCSFTELGRDKCQDLRFKTRFVSHILQRRMAAANGRLCWPRIESKYWCQCILLEITKINK